MEFATALVTLATALVGMFTVLIVKLNRVHTLVNDRLDDALNRIEQLTGRLHDADLEVPAKPSKGNP